MGDFERPLEATQLGDLEQVRGILASDERLVGLRDDSGAGAIHYAAMNGHRAIVRLLVEQGADINCVGGRFGATPTGWAIEYLREMGGHLAIELDDLAYAVRSGDGRWVSRFVTRFPGLREWRDGERTPFRQMARECGNDEIAALFGFFEGGPCSNQNDSA